MPGTYRVESVKLNYQPGPSPSFTLAYAGLLPTTVTMNITLQEVSTDARHENPLPSGFVLQQNFPNPFNPTTRIQFSIPGSGFVRVVVRDILGREVKTLAASVLSAGLHAVAWDGVGASSGVYFYSVEFGGKKLTRRMMLLK